MRPGPLYPCPRQPRTGKVLAVFVMVLTLLLGMVGLVIDGGLLRADHRQAQNAADSAALAAAMELYMGNSPSEARTVAEQFVRQHNGLTGATVAVRFGSEIIDPAAAQHRTDRYVEVVVTNPVRTYFIHILGISPTQTVQCRALAGYEAISSGEGAIVLDPSARPGLSVDGGAQLIVDGGVIVNSRAAGVDQYGTPVESDLTQYALTTSNNSIVKARHILVHGGVDVVTNYQNYDPAGRCPLFCRAPISPDPLRDLPIPRPSNVTSITSWTRQNAVTVTSGESRTFDPGIYEDIQINQGATVTFNPGVYIFSPTKPNQGLRANGNCTITDQGRGVLFYMTGSNYLDNGAGHWDATDDAQNALDGPLPPTEGSYQLPAPPDPQFNSVRFATLDINATNANVRLTGLKDESSPFNGLLFFQRRRNNNNVSIQGNPGENVNLTGTIYAKWAQFKLAGGGKYDAQFVVGSMQVSGQATVTIDSGGKSFASANQVFLVE